MNNQYQFDDMPQENTPSGKNGVNVSSPTKQKALTLGINIFAVIGIISFLSFGVWGTTKIVGNISPQALVAAISNITSIFVPANDKPITFNLETHNVETEVPFTLAWIHKTRQSGTYIFQYECRQNVSVTTQDAEEVPLDILCDTPFSFENEDDTMTLTFFSSESRFIDLPVTITFVPKNSAKATQQGSILLTLVNKNIKEGGLNLQEETGTTVSGGGSVSRGIETSETYFIGSGVENTATNNTGTSDPLGTPDLKVTVLATGIVDKVTNDFTTSVAIGENDRAAIRFEIRNVGTKTSGIWSFIIDLPLSTGVYVFRPSNNQRSLNPGERIEFTLGFDSIDRTSDTAEAIINVDTERRVAETNRDNNTATAVIEVAQ